jgi:hypothetical protein
MTFQLFKPVIASNKQLIESVLQVYILMQPFEQPGYYGGLLEWQQFDENDEVRLKIKDHAKPFLTISIRSCILYTFFQLIKIA